MYYLHQEPLLTDYQLGDLTLRNKVIMASMTRVRTTNAALAPTELHAQYYAQRASAGLQLTESAWVSENAIGFVNVPGIYSQAQIKGWQLVTSAVHQRGGKIFLQVVHSGSVSHPDFFNGTLPIGPSAINPQEKVFTPDGFKDTLVPNAFSEAGIQQTVAEFKQAAKNAKEAGFDGIELHAQKFTLIPQFLSELTNHRTDAYGGSIENRGRLLFDILNAVGQVWDNQRIGIKFTPAAMNAGLIRPTDLTLPMYTYLLTELATYDLAYVQLVSPDVDLKATPLAGIQDQYFAYFRKLYRGTLIANGGFTQTSANQLISEGLADLVAFGIPYIANPDLVERFDRHIPLAEADRSTFYTGGEKGYIDYPPAIR